MKFRPIIVDECCGKRLANYLRKQGEVVYFFNKRKDKDIMGIADLVGAYIITRDRDFNSYENAIYVHGKTFAEIDNMVKTLQRCEIEPKYTG